MKNELQEYLRLKYKDGNTDVDTPHTLRSDVNIRFELGGNLKNGSKDRVDQCVNRALTIFNDMFQMETDEVWIIVYDYDIDSISPCMKYFQSQVVENVLNTFYNAIDTIHTCFFDTDAEGNDIFETREVRILTGKTTLKSINIENILRAKANAEMGFEPSIMMDINFISPASGSIFYMYDDRGCDIFAPDTESIRHIYEKRNSWILDYDRERIDARFT